MTNTADIFNIEDVIVQLSTNIRDCSDCLNAIDIESEYFQFSTIYTRAISMTKNKTPYGERLSRIKGDVNISVTERLKIIADSQSILTPYKISSKIRATLLIINDNKVKYYFDSLEKATVKLNGFYDNYESSIDEKINIMCRLTEWDYESYRLILYVYTNYSLFCKSLSNLVKEHIEEYHKSNSPRESLSEVEDQPVGKGLSNKEQVLLLHKLGILDLDRIDAMTLQNKGILFGLLLGKSPKNTEDFIRYCSSEGHKTSKHNPYRKADYVERIDELLREVKISN